MRRSLWIIPVLLMAIVVPHAKADSISDATTITDLGLTQGTMLPTPDDPRYTFKCCNGAVDVFDLEVAYAAIVTSADLDTPTADKCKGTFDDKMTHVSCKMIKKNDEIIIDVKPAGATFVSAVWSGETGFTPTTPVPEPASIDFLVMGLFGLLGYGWRRTQKGPP
jgi:PEP-CTERM motif-containing protein